MDYRKLEAKDQQL